MRIIGLHGFKSSPTAHFWPWLKTELEKAGHEVLIPALPDSEHPEINAWAAAAIQAVGTLTDNDVLIGHSLGGPTALRLLEQAPAKSTPLACLLLAAPWFVRTEELRPFFSSTFDCEVLMWRAARFVVMHAEDDPVVPLTHAEQYKNALHARLLTVHTGGHFQGLAYPAVLQALEEEIKNPPIYAPGHTLPDAYL